MLQFDRTHLKAIFFDLDDVLVFSETTHTKAWQLTLAQQGVSTDAIDFERFIGVTDMQQAKQFKEILNLEEDHQTLFETKRNTFLDLAKSGLESPAGRHFFLETLANRYVLGVVSSSIRRVINHVLHSEKIASFFQFTIAYEDCERHKPDPYPYQMALAKAEVAPHEALVIEDSLTGITAAQKAAIPVVGLLKNQRADQIVKDVEYFNDFSHIYMDLFKS